MEGNFLNTWKKTYFQLFNGQRRSLKINLKKHIKQNENENKMYQTIWDAT